MEKASKDGLGVVVEQDPGGGEGQAIGKKVIFFVRRDGFDDSTPAWRLGRVGR